MRTLFISDLHLSAERPEAIDCFLGFLAGLSAEDDHLYILGDLFEVWIGDDALAPEHARIMEGFRAFTSKGGLVDVMHGNRDFLLGEGFAARTGCRLLPDPTLIELAGVPTLLSHGDTLCTDDQAYLAYRAHVRNPEVQKHFLALSIEERVQVAREHRNQSKAESKQKSYAIMDVNQGAVEALMREHGVTRLIHGHTHRPAHHRFTLDGKAAERIVLADWYDAGSVLVFADGTFITLPLAA
ncbi:MAG: UDP-2,3-diacylglucosamine diphosphatase [Gammaproteobacteria bacterium]|nr:UDP-2,3-diacylglucosamine diphosphatase [Gammaproteobacteria bacterium]